MMTPAIDKVYPLWRFSLVEKTEQDAATSQQRAHFPLMWLANFAALRARFEQGLKVILLHHIAVQRGYNTPRGYYSGKPEVVAANELNREFNVERPNQWWVTDITYIKTHEGSQYSCRQFRKLIDAYNIKPSMSRRGNCHDNAVAESFFSNLKKEKIRRRIYQNRAEAKQAVFHYIEMVYNPTRRHTKNSRMSPNNFEREYFKQVEGV